MELDENEFSRPHENIERGREREEKYNETVNQIIIWPIFGD